MLVNLQCKGLSTLEITEKAHQTTRPLTPLIFISTLKLGMCNSFRNKFIFSQIITIRNDPKFQIDYIP